MRTDFKNIPTNILITMDISDEYTKEDIRSENAIRLYSSEYEYELQQL